MSTSPNGTDVQIATDPAFSTTVVNSQGAYRTSEVVSTTEFPYGVDLWDLGALRLLTLLLKAKADVQTYFGNNPSSDFAPLTGSQTGCSVKFNLNTPAPCHT